MKILFLTIALSLFSILQAEESTSSEEALEGTYYVYALVGNKEVPEEKQPQAVSPIIISQLNNGNKDVKFTIRKNGKCKEMKIKLEKTDNPNEFTVKQDKRHVHVTKTSISNTWILACEGMFKGELIKIAKLIGPNIDVNPEAFKEFQEFIIEKGFNERKIFSPKQEEACIPEHN